jgi:NADPH:quinone reductase-like Zn-dependent oxidoreductase
VGQRVFGLADWYRDGTLVEYVAIEARDLTPLPGDVDFTVGASLPISGLTAWQDCSSTVAFRRGRASSRTTRAGALGSGFAWLASGARFRPASHRTADV